MSFISERLSGTIRDIFGFDKALIGMVQCPPLPGAQPYVGASMDEICDRCLFDAEHLVEGGFHGLILESRADAVLPDAEDPGAGAAFFSVVADRVRRTFGLPMGISVQSNSVVPALATAVASSADFIRVSPWREAHLTDVEVTEARAFDVARFRAALKAEHVKIFSDADLRQGLPADIADAVPSSLSGQECDCIVATGELGRRQTSIEDLERLGGVTHLPVLAGSGVTEDNVDQILKRTNGVIVAASIKEGGIRWNPVDPVRVAGFVAAAEESLCA